MKITVDVDENYIENEVVIKCSEINEEIINLQKILSTRNAINTKIELYKNNVEFYEALENIIFLKRKADSMNWNRFCHVIFVEYQSRQLLT